MIYWVFSFPTQSNYLLMNCSLPTFKPFQKIEVLTLGKATIAKGNIQNRHLAKKFTFLKA